MEGAASVARDQGTPDGLGDRVGGAADVEGLALRAKDDRDELGVAGESAGGRPR